ncbi:hypothetical protein ACPPVS_01760 [Cellulomonas sp. McL0617]|uniref:hypothetical protein n=1 Tax=Cellulomonas sp. McL0617 TaxID=3415675 RepID=UPI003CF98920
MFVHRTRTAARAACVPALVLALAAGILLPTAAAAASVPRAAAPGAAVGSLPAADPGGGSDGTRLTFGITTASGGAPDARGFIAVDAPPGSTLFDGVGVVNISDAPLDVDLYTADVTNAADGGLDVGRRDDPKSLAGAWVTLHDSSVHVPAQGSKGPGVVLVPVTINVPKDAEPGDHLAAVLSSVTTTGAAGANTPAVDLEQRVGVRVYVRVQGDIRAGLTITQVHSRFRAGSTFGAGTLQVTYTLTNSGNVRLGANPGVRASGIFGLQPRSAKGEAIDELLPHSSVTQTVTLDHVVPLLLENVVVSADAVAARGADDPAIGTVRASTWSWAWSWLVVALLVLVAAVVTTVVVRRRRNRPGVWGPPESPWDDSRPGSPPGGGGAPTVAEPERVS